MNKSNIKVVIDYYTNSCIISGMYEGKPTTIKRPITGLNDHMTFSRNYSAKAIKNGRDYMLYKIEKFQESNPGFKYSEKLIKNVDPLIFFALNRWDMMGETNYALDYLKSIVQIYDKNKSVGKSKATYEEECKLARANELRKSGIDISYNIALLKTAGLLGISDKIRGMRMAELQEKLYGAKVTRNLIMKDRSTAIELNDMKTIENESTNSTEEPIQTHTIKTKDESSKIEITKREVQNNNNSEKSKKERKEKNQQPTKKTKKSVERRREREEKKSAYEAAKIKKAEENIAHKKAEQERIAKIESEKASKIRAEQEKIEKAKLEAERVARLKAEQEKNSKTEKKDAENLKAEQERKAMAKAKRAEKLKAEQERFSNAKAEAEKLVKEKEKTSSGFFKGIIGKIKKDSSNKTESNSTNSKGRWGRKILDAKDSILNKQFIKKEDSIKKEDVKKFAVTGVATLLAAGSLVAAVNVSNNSNNYNVPITEDETTSSISEHVNNNSSKYNVSITENKTTSSVNESVSYNSPDIPEVYNEPKSNLTEKNSTAEKIQPNNSKKENLEENLPKKEDIIKDDVTKKSDEEKIKEFKDFAFKKYMSAFVIGEKPKVSILNNSYFSEKPDGSGKLGSFKKHPNYDISHINIVTKDGTYKKVDLEGENLDELLNECTDYSIHFVDSKTGSGYGFVQKSQLEALINEIIDVKTDELMDSILNDNVQTNNNNELDYDDWIK